MASTTAPSLVAEFNTAHTHLPHNRRADNSFDQTTICVNEQPAEGSSTGWKC
jgi:hypothetical protein